ncbi:MAG: hypothetical protein IKW78_05865 [Prevotella sp.]|nr:hypothetical protein [Prevotella sp.]
MNKNKGFPLPLGGVRGGFLLLLMLFPLATLAQTLTQYEFWFDDDFANRRSIGLSGKEKEISLSIDTYFLETGPHRLSLRVKQSDGKYSAITTSSFLKVIMGEAKWLEYWFDGDQTQSKRIAGTAALDGNGYVFNSEVDISGLSVGNHQLYYRAVSDDGLISTAVSVSPFLKLITGEAKWLEYWFDGDRANMKRMAGTKATDGNGYVFSGEADISGLSPGHHWMYCRAVSDNGKVSSSVSASSVVVKLLAEQQQMASDAKISGYRISVDGKDVETRRFSNPKFSWDLDEPLDVHTLKTGNHTAKVTFWNTAGGFVSVDHPFEVLAPPAAPTITLAAAEKNGVVSLEYNSVPNDVTHRLVRVDANGASALVTSEKKGIYPRKVSFPDNPAAGSYTYYVQMSYIDPSGEKKTVRSNEVNVTIANPQTEEVVAQEYGYVTGTIVCDKNNPAWSKLTVNVSDMESNPIVKSGKFKLQQLPVGTTLTLTVTGDEQHDYEAATVTIKAGENNVTINGTLREEYYPSSLEHDLSVSSVETFIKDDNGKRSHAVKLKVKNLSAQNTWKGKVRVEAIDTESSRVNKWLKRNRYEGKLKEDLELAALKEAELEIVIDELSIKEAKEFKLYLYSEGYWVGFDETNVEKQIELDSKSSNSDYLCMTFEKAGQNYTKWDDDAREDFAYLMLGLGSLTPGFENVVGDFSPYLPTMEEFAKKRWNTTDTKDAVRQMFDWLSGKSALEAINDFNAYNVSSSGVSLISELMSAAHPSSSVLQKFKNGVIKEASKLGKASDMIGGVVEVAKAIKSEDPLERAMHCSKLILTTMASEYAPLNSIMYTYTTVGKALIDKVRQYEAILGRRYLLFRLNHNKPYTGGCDDSDENRQNTGIDFKLVVKNSDGKAIDFTQAKYRNQIKSISIRAAYVDKNSDPIKYITGPSIFRFEIVPLSDGVMLKTDGNGHSGEGSRYMDDNNDINSLCMVINWANKRQTIIPLIGKSTIGVDYMKAGTTPTQEVLPEHLSTSTPVVYTVTLTTGTGEDNMADELYLGKNKKRE